MGLPVSVRTATVGAQLDILVLAAIDGTAYGVDLASGALVRATHVDIGNEQAISAFDVLRGSLCPPEPDADPSRPEEVVLEEHPRVVGRADKRQIERLLRPLRHPENEHILGFPGPAVEYWRLCSCCDRPSMALVESPSISLSASSVRFAWMGSRCELPAAPGLRAPLGKARRLLVAMTPPETGWCTKQVVALLP